MSRTDMALHSPALLDIVYKVNTCISSEVLQGSAILAGVQNTIFLTIELHAMH